MNLVLSLFPGIGMLDMGFELEGFCVVRGPDVLWGGDVRRFHPPADRFDGVIGGPPCQSFSPIGNVNRARWGEDSIMEDLIPEFSRVVHEARPDWWLMENSPLAYSPFPEHMSLVVDSSWLGEEQTRKRKFWSSLPIRRYLEVPALVPPSAGSERTVCSKDSVDWRGSRSKEPARMLSEMLRLQGAPPDLFGELDEKGRPKHSPFRVDAMRKMVGNGVPIPMARALARAVKRALESTPEAQRDGGASARGDAS